jgi:hypothetical protein
MTIRQWHQLHDIVDYARIEGSGEVPFICYSKAETDTTGLAHMILAREFILASLPSRRNLSESL